MVLLVAFSIVRIKVTTRVQLIVGIVTVLVILVVDIVTTAKGGASGNTGKPFTFSHTAVGGFHGVFYGIIFGITSYIGFETAADFGEETTNPRRAIPIAIIAATGLRHPVLRLVDLQHDDRRGHRQGRRRRHRR